MNSQQNPKRAELEINILSYWHVGSGHSTGAKALMLKDEKGFPVLPGRSVKGLLRDAMLQAEEANWFEYHDQNHQFNQAHFSEIICDLRANHSSLTELFFGPLGKEGKKTFAGGLKISSACSAYLFQQSTEQDKPITEQDQLKSILYRQIASTRINSETGAAQEQSLRSIEVAVPMPLVCELEWIAEQPLPGWTEYLDCALPLIRSVGAWRSRGLGRAQLKIMSHY